MTLRAGVFLVATLAVSGGAGAADYPRETDVATIDGIIEAYYDVVSGPTGHRYDAERDRSLHAPNAIITRMTAAGELQRHDLATEQIPLMEPYASGFYEHELKRIVERYGNLAQVWSSFEIRATRDGPAESRGVNSVSLYFHEGRWWIASWSTQAEGDEPLPARYVE